MDLVSTRCGQADDLDVQSAASVSSLHSAHNFQRGRSKSVNLWLLLISASFMFCALIIQVNSTSTSRGISRGPDLSSPDELFQDDRSIRKEYFKIHIIPARSSPESHSKRLKMRRQSFRRATGSSVSSVAASLDNQLSTPVSTTVSSASNQADQSSGPKQKISNATLRKLLNQSLIKAGNASNSFMPIKGSNFKFVFLQRAPQSNDKKVTNSGDTTVSTQSSLAASVSKHIATSLLNSAVSFVGNLSSAPSLSSLASQIGLDGKISSTVSMSSSTTSKPANSLVEYQMSSSEQQSHSVAPDKPKRTSIVGAINTKTKQPSKVYNLPVKFASNGQASHVAVINTIKKHFASIKKLQEDGRLSMGSLEQESPLGPSSKRKRQPYQINQIKKNSRIIYLPLKYLSNAKPGKVINMSKRLHKSEN